MAKPIPEGYHAVTPSFTFKDSQKAVEFYKKAFGAKVLDLLPNLTNDEIRKGAEAFFAQMAKKAG
jgi:uncharacterized glyoxalase superfamily protein PhnB